MTDPKTTRRRLKKNLNILREREAKWAGNAPLELLNQIADHETAIALTEQAHTGEISGVEWHTQMQPLLVSLRLEEPRPPSPVELAVAEQRYRAALKAAFATEADAYIPQTVESTEITTAPQPRPNLSPRAAQRLRRRAGAEYAKLVGQGQEPKRVKLNTLREAVDQYNCIILLGAPGSGKTTSLENLAYQLADEPERIPLLLRLSEFGPDQSLDDFIRRGWGGALTAGYWGEPLLAGQLDSYLAEGKLFILFDALNEMPQQGYKQRAADLRRFLDRWTKAGNRFMVTCRVLDYGEELTDLQRVEVLPFTDEQIQTLLQNDLPDDWQALWKELNEEKRANHREPLLELARNPYLLTMMIDVYAVQGELGRNRAELMQRFTTILLEWAKAKVPPGQWIKTEALQQVLAALAFEMQIKAGFGARMDVANVVDALPREVKPGPAWPSEPTPADRVLTLAASANLIEMPVDRSAVRFSHQLLHEYFTARYIVENNRYQLLAEYLTDDRWHVTFLLTASMTDEAGNFFVSFRQALDGLIENDPVLVDLLRWTNRKSESTPSPGNTLALKAYYIFLDHLRYYSYLESTFERALEYAFELARVLASDLLIALARARAHAGTRLDIHNPFELARVLGLGAALDYCLNISLQSGFMIEQIYDDNEIHAQYGDFAAYFTQAAHEAGEVAPPLAAALAALSVPTESTLQAAWHEFNAQLRQLMLEHRDLGHDWNLSQEQVNTLANYLKANLLLLECLDVAHVTNRDAIKNSLLSPPGEWEF